jgi:hypothetical protein
MPDRNEGAGRPRRRKPAKITATEGHPVRHEGREITVVRIKGRGRRYRLIIESEKDSE